jgi:hypothetical protein
MADIINSSEHDQQKLMKNFKKIVSSTNQHNNEKLLSPLTITLGDECQGLSRTLSDSIEIIFELKRKAILSEPRFSLRFSCVYGEIDTPINKESAYGMLGQGLTNARKLLNEKSRDQPNLQIDVQNPLIEGLLKNSFEILYLTETLNWVNKDKNIINDFIYSRDLKGHYLTDTEIGKRNNKNQSQITKYKKNWDIELYRTALDLVKVIILHTDEYTDEDRPPSLKANYLPSTSITNKIGK